MLEKYLAHTKCSVAVAILNCLVTKAHHNFSSELPGLGAMSTFIYNYSKLGKSLRSDIFLLCHLYFPDDVGWDREWIVAKLI